jgi:hypothetical protein
MDHTHAGKAAVRNADILTEGQWSTECLFSMAKQKLCAIIELLLCAINAHAT